MARNNSKRKTNECPVKRATAYKTRKEGQALILKELKWSIFAVVLILGIILLYQAGVDLKLVADIVAASGLGDIGTRLAP
ncbi:hypothetical protein ACOSZF_21235 [Cytobacillus firmus]|uniref:Uncharacterized protein n=1 Tax=Cytobacillus firmus TaxID=1399 RepID=A0A380X8N6_CYTFI|nr:hypothetical protein [Cytobacillus firmus]KAF0821299.1 hypothetical protein KIS1582_4994 [Cytobacillus firmus]MBG9545254.1 hypothetical protein [Cytobacillus firmus]MBG9546941.1 hypothetical protein [Cytobacillus firmus]MBG9554498.1 hypothetical protein [Cytobacillus firmus]MBG9559069.1 hypothetical protein [Cytobacillus firmus]